VRQVGQLPRNIPKVQHFPEFLETSFKCDIQYRDLGYRGYYSSFQTNCVVIQGFWDGRCGVGWGIFDVSKNLTALMPRVHQHKPSWIAWPWLWSHCCSSKRRNELLAQWYSV